MSVSLTGFVWESVCNIGGTLGLKRGSTKFKQLFGSVTDLLYGETHRRMQHPRVWREHTHVQFKE